MSLSSLLSPLPEHLWPEAARRVVLVSELEALAADPAVRAAWLTLTEAAQWRPGPLALTAYAARHPECEGQAEAWLLNAARDQVTSAYLKLAAPEAEALQPIEESVLAALALRLRALSTHDFKSIAREAANDAARWRLPLQYLWGLLPPEPEALFTALLSASEAGAQLAARALLVNMEVVAATAWLTQLNLHVPAAHWRAFARALEAEGQADYSYSVMKAILALPHFSAPYSCLERAQLLAATGDLTLARTALTEAWEQTRRWRVAMSQHLGELALRANDGVLAYAGFEDALKDGATDSNLIEGFARAHLQLGRAEEALNILRQLPRPPAVVMARAHLALGKPLTARETLHNLEATDAPAQVLAEAAHIYSEAADPHRALAVMRVAAQRARTDATLYLIAAQWALQLELIGDAIDLAAEAALLQPHHADTRLTLGQALLAHHEAQRALPHFQSALIIAPDNSAAAVGFARAALDLGQPVPAQATLEKLIARADLTPALTGEAHTLMGRALSAQQQDEAAFEHFRRASALVPTAPEPWRAMAKHHRQRGETAHATAALEAGRQALTLIHSMDLAPVLVDLAETYSEAGRMEEALLALREASAQAQPPTGTHRRLGMLLRQHGPTLEAIAVLQTALRVAPHDAVAQHELGLAYEANQQLEEAWGAYQQAVLAQPAEAAPYFNLGRLTLALQHARHPSATAHQAAVALRHGLARDPHNAEAYAALAQAYLRLNEPEQAFECYQHALAHAPLCTAWLLGLGEVCLALELGDMALAVLAEAAEQQATDPTVQLALARACAFNHLWPEAVRAAEVALRYAPNDTRLLAFLAEVYARNEQPGMAAEAWRAAVALEPRQALLHLGYATHLMKARQPSEARAVFAQALALGPENATVQLTAGQALLEMGEAEQAYQVLQRAAELAPHALDAHAALGLAAKRAHHYAAAYNAYSRAAELQPTHWPFVVEAGEALWALGRTAAALAVWQRALIESAHNDLSVVMRVGLAHGHLQQWAEALAIFEEAVKQHPTDAGLRREAARAALMLAHFESAAQHAEHALHTRPTDAEAHYILGRALAGQQHWAQALLTYQHAVRFAPNEGRYHVARAEALLMAGERDDALTTLAHAVALSPDNGEVQQQAGELYLRAECAAPAASAALAATAFGQWASARPRDPAAQLALARALLALAEANDDDTRADLIPASPTVNFSDQLFVLLHKAAALGAGAQVVQPVLGRAQAVLGDPAEAIVLLEKILPAHARGAETAPLLRALALAYRRAGQMERAREALHAALKHDPTSAKLYIDLGLTAMEAHDARGASALFKRALACDGTAALALYHLAETLWLNAEASEALALLHRALALRPNAAAWHYRLAQHLQASQPAATLAHLHRAVQLAPAQAEYTLALAHALAADGDWRAALAHFQRATEAAPSDAHLWTERGRAHLALNDYRPAAASFARAILLAPAHVPALLGSARAALALGDSHDALNKAEAATRLAPTDAEVLETLAAVQCARGDFAQAEAALLTAIAHAAQPLSAQKALGELYLTLGNTEQAFAVLSEAAQAHPEADEVLALLGEASLAADELDTALAAFREAARLAPREPRYWLRLGQVGRLQGQLDQALAHLLQARELDPLNADIARETGWVFEQRKQPDRAVEMYHEALRLAPHCPQNHTRLGVALKQLKDYGGAVSALEYAVALDPKNLEATKQLAVVSALHLMHAH